MNDKAKNGLIHCVNYICVGCPYELTDAEVSRLPSSAGGYVRCMQRLLEDIYEDIKDIEDMPEVED